MSIEFKSNIEWEVLSFSIINFAQLNKEIIIKHFQNKYDKDFDKYDFNVEEIIKSTTTDRLSGITNHITLFYGIKEKNRK